MTQAKTENKKSFSRILQQHWRLISLLLAAVTLMLAVISLAVGYYSLSARDVFAFLLSPLTGAADFADATPTVVLHIRLPRVLAALLIGAGLSVSGCAYQGMFRNPLVSPDILGVTSGAAVGASVAITAGLSDYGVQLAAFLCGMLVVLLTVAISRRSRHSRTLSLVLTGMMLGSLCTAITSGLKYIADPSDALPAITFWLMGSLAKVDMAAVLPALIPVTAGMLLIWLMRYRLNLLALDDEEAAAMGVNIRRDRGLVIFAATLLSASAVCLGGMIGWVGLMMPHLARGLVGADYRRLLPASALLGGAFLLVMDDIARSLLVMEIPIGILTAFLGAPFFVLLILRRR